MFRLVHFSSAIQFYPALINSNQFIFIYSQSLPFNSDSHLKQFISISVQFISSYSSSAVFSSHKFVSVLISYFSLQQLTILQVLILQLLPQPKPFKSISPKISQINSIKEYRNKFNTLIWVSLSSKLGRKRSGFRPLIAFSKASSPCSSYYFFWFLFFFLV